MLTSDPNAQEGQSNPLIALNSIDCCAQLIIYPQI